MDYIIYFILFFIIATLNFFLWFTSQPHYDHWQHAHLVTEQRSAGNTCIHSHDCYFDTCHRLETIYRLITLPCMATKFPNNSHLPEQISSGPFCCVGSSQRSTAKSLRCSVGLQTSHTFLVASVGRNPKAFAQKISCWHSSYILRCSLCRPWLVRVVSGAHGERRTFSISSGKSYSRSTHIVVFFPFRKSHFKKVPNLCLKM